MEKIYFVVTFVEGNTAQYPYEWMITCNTSHINGKRQRE